MKNLLMDPRFPDLVEEWAAEKPREAHACANDNKDEQSGDFADLLLTALGRLEIGATRLW